MRRFFLIFGLFAALVPGVYAAPVLTSVRQIRRLTPSQVEQQAPVQIEGVVTFYEPAEHILFVEDSTGPIFIRTRGIFPFAEGDRIAVRGVTASSYQAVIASEDMRRIGRSPLPRPTPAAFAELMTGRWDCAYVTVAGTVLSATIQQTIGAPFLLLEVRMDGGSIDVHVENPGTIDPHALLDAQVVLTGVSGGRFDGKFQLVGANLYLNSPAGMRIVASSPDSPDALPLTPMDRIMSSYNIPERSPRLRVRGSITLYEPGSQVVLESEGKAALIHTHQHSPLNIGDVVDATGFPSINAYTQSLTHGQFTSVHQVSLIHPQPAQWEDAVLGKYAFNLISIDGRLIEQVHEPSQDTLFINSGGHVFSAVLRHPWVPDMRLPSLPAGSLVRASGVCFVANGGPWKGALEFQLHMRDARDVQVLAWPSWWSVTHMVYVIGLLGLIVFAALAWGGMLRWRVHRQTQLIHRTMRDEAARERRQAGLEKDRSLVLEAINSRTPLPQVLRMIGDLISKQVEGLECWCELAGEPSERVAESPRQARRDIISGTGERLGSLVLAWSSEEEPPSTRSEAVERGASLAALAIDNRRLYESLIHRSEYDQLTEVPNRFLLESRLEHAFVSAQRHERIFALIYIDLDRFKSVNDRYGHRIGDLYLQNVARRLSEKLRSHDTLARVGGDEFIVLIPVVQDRVEAEDIARRLNQCFDFPFRIDGHTIEGSASVGVALYPQDGVDEDQLKRTADSAMYASKQRVIDWE